MGDSTFRRINLLGSAVSGNGGNPIRLIASASSRPMRVLINFVGAGAARALLAFDEADLGTLLGINPTDAVYRLRGPQQDVVVILAPQQKLYAASLNGFATTFSVATSDAVPLRDILDASTRAMGVPSRLQTVNFTVRPGTIGTSDLNDPPSLCTAPDWSPLFVSLTWDLPGFLSPFLNLAEDQDLLRQGPNFGYALNPRLRQNFILAPFQSLYATVNANAFVAVSQTATVSVSTTLFTDVFSAVPITKPSNEAVARVLWNSLWQGSDGVCF
jgi:hypothetical protein